MYDVGHIYMLYAVALVHAIEKQLPNPLHIHDTITNVQYPPPLPSLLPLSVKAYSTHRVITPVYCAI